jgi:hypothetical protein
MLTGSLNNRITTIDLVLYSEMAGKSGVPILVGEASKVEVAIIISLFLILIGCASPMRRESYLGGLAIYHWAFAQ